MADFFFLYQCLYISFSIRRDFYNFLTLIMNINLTNQILKYEQPYIFDNIYKLDKYHILLMKSYKMWK